MDIIKIGLDFGTHQTKICVQTTPDEGHGEPKYEFFEFTDLGGNSKFFLPSVIQINEDNTLSYGFFDTKRQKKVEETIEEEPVYLESLFTIDAESKRLFNKYQAPGIEEEDIHIIESLLDVRLKQIKARNTKKMNEAKRRYEEKTKALKERKTLFRYFKQDTFIGAEREGNKYALVGHRTLCVWYLAYVIFLLEEEYGDNFSINMGVPADEATYDAKKRLGVEILASAYHLVEDVYNNDLTKFLGEDYQELLKKTENIKYTDELKENYNISIFPEAYASLIALTSRGKLPTGMSIAADIGGGTTDVSFFIIEDRKDKIPLIYKYWSIPRGLNYLANRSGFEYEDGDFSSSVQTEAVAKLHQKINELISLLVKDLSKKLSSETDIPVRNLLDALKNRILVYSGGGSTYTVLTKPINTFNDVRVVDGSVWQEENVRRKSVVSNLAPVLSTAYGLSVSADDSSLKLKSYSSLFSHIAREENYHYKEISKDVC